MKSFRIAALLLLVTLFYVQVGAAGKKNFFATKYSIPSNPTLSSVTSSPATYCLNGTPSQVSLSASTVVAPGCTVGSAGYVPVSIQWYYNTTNSTTGGTAFGSADNSQFANTVSSTSPITPLSSSSGTLYYYAVISWNLTGCASAGSVTSGTYQVNITTSAAPTITTQPSTTGQTNLCQTASGSSAAPLGISASSSTSISTYQWYSNSSPSNSGGSLVATHSTSATSDSYTPSTTATGTLYYYCIVTNSGGCSATSNVSGTISVTNKSLTVGTQPSTLSQTVCQNSPASALSIVAAGATGWQWYSSPNSDGSNATSVSGATSASYTPSTNTLGTLYYYCVATKNCSVTSNVSGAIITANPISAGSPSSNPTICINTAMTNITISTTNATGIGTPTGLPAGVTANWASNTITISGTPTASGTFNYSIPLVGNCTTNVTASGTITVKANNTAGVPSSTPTLCINTALTNITITTTGSTGISNDGVTGANNLPAGVSAHWASNTITISGTPTASGTFNYSIPLTGGCGSVNATGTITVTASNTAGAPSSTPTLCVNTALTSITIATTGATGIGVASGLPAGVSAAFGSNTITISGTPTASGTFNYSIPLTGGCGSVNATGTITVITTNTAGTPSSIPTLCVNTALTSITIATAGATGISNAGVSGANGLPGGVSATWASNTITISGTPTASGVFSYSIPLTGGCGSVNATGTITVITSNTAGSPSSTPTLCINTALTSITIATTGATGISNDGVSGANGLPGGVSATWASNTITISGTPTASGVFGYSIPLTGGCGSVNATGTITVTANNTAGTPSLTPTLCVNTVLTSITITTTGATGVSNDGVSGANGLPSGVSATWASNTITISGTPTASGVFSYSIPMTGGCGSVNATGTITVTPNNTAGTPSSTPTLCINTALTSITIATTGATGISNDGVSGANGLPAGVSATWASNTITISGTPTANGVFSYSIPLTGGCGSVNATGTITVNTNNTAGSPSSTPTLCINTALTSITIATTGATGISNDGVSGANGLPGGVSATWASNTITISGTPTASGTFNYSIALTGGCGGVNASGTITVTPDNTISLTSGVGSDAQPICLGDAINDITYSTTGATGASFSGLPSGVGGSWSSSTVTISGTPSSAGAYPYTVTLTGGCGVVTANGTVTVVDPSSTTKIWKGITNNWFTSFNWTCNVVPSTADDVIIPSGSANYPVIANGATISAKSININSGGSLTMSAGSFANIAGDFTVDGTYADNGALVTFSGSPSTINGGSLITFYNLTVGSGSLVQENTAGVQLTNVLNLGSNIFDTDGASGNKVFTLLSTNDNPTADANINTLTGTPSTQLPGKITVQRHMNRIGVSAYDYQVWRDISAPVQNASVGMLQKSIPVTGPFSGTSIVSTTTPTGGTTNYTQSSLIYFNEATNAWVGFPLTSSGTDTSAVFTSGKGYSVFIFGPDSETPVGSGNDSWWLRGIPNTGSFTPSITYNSTTGKGWNLIGNPYPSTIDWTKVTRNGKVSNAVYIDDYNTTDGTAVFASWISNSSGVTSTNGGTPYIAMGQSFWIKATGSSPSITIKETSKAAGTQTTFFRQKSPENQLRVTLVSSTNQRDETVIYFTDKATEGVDTEYDAEKLMNRFGHINLSSISGANDRFSINGLPTSCSRTVSLDISDVKTGSYRLDFSGLSSFPSTASIHVKDNLSNTSVDVRQTISYSFNVDASNPSTFGPNRFVVEFNDGSNKNVKPAEISAVDQHTLHSNYTQGNQWYYNGSFIDGATGQDFKPLHSGLYRVEIMTNGCRVSAEKLFIGESQDGDGVVRTYPNPTKGTFTLEVDGTEEAHAEIYNSMGVKLSTINFVNEGSMQRATYSFSEQANGMYIIRIAQSSRVSFAKVIKE
jgi:hypothetical protein